MSNRLLMNVSIDYSMYRRVSIEVKLHFEFPCTKKIGTVHHIGFELSRYVS